MPFPKAPIAKMWSKAFGLLSQKKSEAAAESEQKEPVQSEPVPEREGAPEPQVPVAQRSLADLLSGLGKSKKKSREASLMRTQTEPILATTRAREPSSPENKSSLKRSGGLKDSLTLMLDNLGERQVRKRGIPASPPKQAKARSERGIRLGRPARPKRSERSHSSRGDRGRGTRLVKRYDRAREGRYPRYETKVANFDPRRQSFPRRKPQQPLRALPAWRKRSAGDATPPRSPPALVAPKSSSNSDKSQTPRRDTRESPCLEDPKIMNILEGMQKLGGNQQTRWADCSDDDMQWD